MQLKEQYMADKIDQNIHLIRDLIELANKHDDTTAFIFLDQEKAFDRVNHNFLFKAMVAFGSGKISSIGYKLYIQKQPQSSASMDSSPTTSLLTEAGMWAGIPT